MAVDYTVIQPVRQRFGDTDFGGWEESQVELEAPFVGREKEFPFSCPNIDSGQMGVLQFESFGLTSRSNVIEINGIAVPGGLTSGPWWLGQYTTIAFWKAHSLLVPTNMLAERNVLYIKSVDMGDDEGGLDNFIIDNIVLFFKTRTSGGLGGIRDIAPA
jgi:hypothetical protein